MKNNPSKKVFFIALCSGIAIVAISFMKNALELEDAEQAYYSQWWRWGYDDQPPLYTWMQILVNYIFGVSKFSFSFLRGLIFSASLLALYQFAMEIIKDKSKAALVVFSLVLIPTFIDFTFRRLSHTSLLILAILATYFIVNRLRQNKSILNYCLLGVVISVGILAKYNYVFLLGALFLGLFFDEKLRKVVLNWRIVISLSVVGITITPHLLWLLNHNDYVTELNNSIHVKTGSGSEGGILFVSPILSFVVSFLKLLLPLLVFILIAFLLKKVKFNKTYLNNWLSKLFLLQLLILVIGFVVLDVQKVEVRWLLPLFVPFLVLFFEVFHVENIKKWVQYGFYAFLMVLFLQTLRAPVEKIMNISSSVHFGFQPISEKLQKNYVDRDWVLPDVTYGGNLRVLNLEKEVFSLDDFSLPTDKIDSLNTVFVFKHQKPVTYDYIVVDSIQNFGKEQESLFFTFLRH